MTPELQTIRLSEIVFDEVIYPRRDHDPMLVQRYSIDLEEIEAAQKYISVSADRKLLDGKHRWLGYRKRYGDEDREIRVLVYPVSTPHEQLQLAAKLNSDHGWQLTEADKIDTAKSLYAYGYTFETIAASLSVGKAKVSEWLSKTVRDNREKRDRKIFDLWLACHTQEEIAETTETPIGTVKRLLGDGEDNLVQRVLENQTNQIAASHATDFDPPLYTVWTKAAKTPGPSHFGNTEVQWVDNLLYLYTKPFDVVVDPFAGGGSTIDICKKRFRRYYVSDRKPIVEREKEIRSHDLTDGLPGLPRWKDVSLVYLDPPYWKQAEGQYSTDPTDLANMELVDFNSNLAGIIKGFASKLKGAKREGPAYIALIIQPTQWKAPERQFTDHVGDMLRAVSLPVQTRIFAPYSTEQCNAQMVEWAKENKDLLVISREIIVWKV